MKARLNIPGSAVIVSLIIGCGGAEPPDSAEVVLPGDQTVTRPDIESPQAVPPSESTTASTDTPATTADPGATATPDPSQTPSSEPAAGPATTGTEFARFTGRITVDGNFSELAPLVQAGAPDVMDKICVQSAVPNESVVVGTGGGLADVFVYARKIPDGIEVPEPPEEPAVLDQQKCRFVPQAFVFRVDQPLQMINTDPVAHNVKIAGFTLQFNQTIGANNQEGLTVTYERAERVPVATRCGIHGWMVAWHFAVDHPWAAVSGEDGTFVIDDLPAGDWEFIIWHNKTGYIERSHKFSAATGEVIEDNFSVPVAELQ